MCTTYSLLCTQQLNWHHQSQQLALPVLTMSHAGSLPWVLRGQETWKLRQSDSMYEPVVVAQQRAKQGWSSMLHHLAAEADNVCTSQCHHGLLEQSCAVLQDIVTQGGKFLVLYKRPGHRVLVNSSGVMMVSPSAIETSVQQHSGGMPHALSVTRSSACSNRVMTLL